MNTFGNRLKTLRLEKDLTQTELANVFGLTKSAISSQEVRGRFPDEELIKTMANYFQVSTDYLLGVSDVRIINADPMGFTEKLIKQLLESGNISDANDIDSNIVDMIKSALRLDAKNKKGV